jgi:hypothetical protein
VTTTPTVPERFSRDLLSRPGRYIFRTILSQESHGSTLRDIDAALELEANGELEELKAELIAAVDAAKQGLLQVGVTFRRLLLARAFYLAQVSERAYVIFGARLRV